jgi:hypothetical protein
MSRLPMTDVCPSCGVVYWKAQGHSCGSHRVSRVRGFFARLAGCLLILVPARHANRCGCPLCNRAEREARAELGVPLRHPEQITRGLAARQEEYLDLLAEELWPDDDYASILANPWRED